MPSLSLVLFRKSQTWQPKMFCEAMFAKCRIMYKAYVAQWCGVNILIQDEETSHRMGAL